MSNLTPAPKGTRTRAASPGRPALPGIPSNSLNTKIPKIPKAKLQAGLQKFGNGLPGSQRPDTMDAVKDERPSEWPSLRKGRPPRPRGTSRVFHTQESPVQVPDGGRRCSYLVSILPSPPHKKGNLGPARILGNVLCNRLYAGFHRTARYKIAGFGALERIVRLSAATSGGRGEGFPAETAVYKH